MMYIRTPKGKKNKIKKQGDTHKTPSTPYLGLNHSTKFTMDEDQSPIYTMTHSKKVHINMWQNW